MEEEEEELEPARNRMSAEKLDVDSLRSSYEQPSRLQLRWTRMTQGLRSRTLLTIILALAIVGVLVLGYYALN